MILGASTSCFYPLETEKALQELANLKFKKAEVFMNALCELEEDFGKKLDRIAKDGDVDIISVHPFSSFMESSCIFGDYQRRFDDFIGIYEKTCHLAAVMGAKYVVIHGAVATPKIPIPNERYFQRFQTLVDIGKTEGVTVCQENVNKFKSQSMEFCKEMKAALGDDYNMVFDIKQAVRAGEDPYEFLKQFIDCIKHIHISDNGAAGDCLPPGKGDFDFKWFKEFIDKSDYQGDAVIEIYSSNLNVHSELEGSKVYLEKLWQK